MLYVDPDSLDSQAAFLAPTARDVRTQRRDTPRSATLDNPPSQPIASVQRDVFLASPFVLLTRNLRVLLRYSRTFPSLKHSCDSFNLPSLSSRTKTNPLMGNRKSSYRPLRHGSVKTTLTSTSYSDTFSLVETMPYTAKPHPVGTTTPTPQCLSATVLFRTTATFGTPTISLLHSTLTL